MYQDLSINKLLKFKNKGFTYLEIMVCVLLFGILSISLANPLCESLKLTRIDRIIIDTNNLAKLYLKNLEIAWSQTVDFDNAVLPALNSTYTASNAFNVTISKTDLFKNASNITIVRRVAINYKDKKNNNLIDFYIDYNRP